MGARANARTYTNIVVDQILFYIIQQFTFLKVGRLKILESYSLRYQENRFAHVIEEVKRRLFLLLWISV